jgi:hypothetical protein
MKTMIKKHILYASYIVKHKWFVYRAGVVLGVSKWRLVKHDLSKLLPSEWTPYSNWFNGTPEERDKDKFKAAVKLHKGRNDHHFEHWLQMLPMGITQKGWVVGPSIVTNMPEEAFLEMVADWSGAGREIHKRWSPRKWWTENPAVRQSFSYRDQSKIDRLITKLEEHFK